MGVYDMIDISYDMVNVLVYIGCAIVLAMKLRADWKLADDSVDVVYYTEYENGVEKEEEEKAKIV